MFYVSNSFLVRASVSAAVAGRLSRSPHRYRNRICRRRSRSVNGASETVNASEGITHRPATHTHCAWPTWPSEVRRLAAGSATETLSGKIPLRCDPDAAMFREWPSAMGQRTLGCSTETSVSPVNGRRQAVGRLPKSAKERPKTFAGFGSNACGHRGSNRSRLGRCNAAFARLTLRVASSVGPQEQ